MSITIIFTRRFWLILLVALLIGAFFLFRSTFVQVILENLTPPNLPNPEPVSERVVFDQNWSDETTERFHFISQGTGTLPIPYHWLLALEQPETSPFGLLIPGKKPAFTDAGYIERYGFIPAAASVDNPDGLPIGFATTPFQNLAGYPVTTTAVGLTCAACHTGRLSHNGTEYIVNGGPATSDLQLFSKGLGAALGQTLFSSKLPLPNKRFDRFARNVLGEAYSKTAKSQLAKDMQSVVEAGAAQADQISVVEGYGRLDALNRIGNQVFSKNTGRRDNYKPINAPVNYPQIWTASWFDWVQYDGSIMQPLIRNAGEALGVHAAINTTAPEGQGRFSSSIPVKNLKWIEDSLAGAKPPLQEKAFGGLHAPEWPAAFGAIDQALADKGAALYQQRCQSCHLPALTSDAIWSDRYFQKIAYQENGQSQETREAFLALNILPLKTIGTDPAQADILELRTVNTAGDVETGAQAMGIDATVCTPEPTFTGPGPQYASSELDTKVTQRYRDTENELVQVHVSDGPMVSFALALGAIVQQTNETWFDNNFISEEMRSYFEGERPNCLQKGAGYKARPLNGVWATAPFLHNGSVPTLDALLRPVDERPRFVRLGDTAFDPVKVGLAQPDLSADSYSAYEDGYFILDTGLAGNLNTGHAFGASADGDKRGVIGPKFSDDERAAIIEFIKTLK